MDEWMDRELAEWQRSNDGCGVEDAAGRSPFAARCLLDSLLHSLIKAGMRGLASRHLSSSLCVSVCCLSSFPL